LKTKLYVLIIEDNESDAALALRAIENGGYHVIARQVMTREDMLTAMADQTYDLILADYNVPGFGAKEALTIVQESQLDIPFILISGIVGEETAVEMMKLGVHDYIMKDSLMRLGGVVTREIQEAANRQQMKKVEAEQREFSSLMKRVQQMSHLGSWTWSISTGQVEWSDELYKIYHKDKASYVPTFEGYLQLVHEEDRNRIQETIYSALTHSKEVSFEERVVLSDGKIKMLQSWASVILDEQQKPVKMYGACLDVTSLKNLQIELDQSQERLKSIVANNIDIITLLDSNGIIQFQSESIQSILGYHKSELIGSSAFDIIHPEDYEPTLALFERLVSGVEDSVTAIFRYKHKLGHYITLEARTANQLNNPSVQAIIINSRDITERIKANLIIQESQRQIKEVSESIPGAVYQFHYTLSGGIDVKYISDGITSIFGLSPTAIYSNIDAAFGQIEPVHLNNLLTTLSEAHAHLSPWLCYFQVNDQKGETRWIRCNAIPKKIENDATLWNGTLIDITDTKNAEMALQISRQTLEIEKRRLKNIIEGTNVGTWEYDIPSGEVLINERWADILGYSSHEIGNLKITQLKGFMHPDDLRHASDLLKRHIEGKNPNYQCEIRFKHKLGYYVWVLNIGKVVAWDDAGKPLLLSGSCQDITEQKNTENLILRSAVAAEEKERERLSKELHDGIAQNMVAMSLYLSNLSSESKEMSVRSQDIIRQINELIADTIEETRQVSHDLMPRVLNEHGFIGAVETLFDRISRIDKIKYQLNIKGSETIGDPLISINLYRVIQEFIKNTQKYSQASRVMLNIEFKDHKLHMYISDDGIGFDRSLPSRGVGLQNMFSRINSIGGNYSLSTAEGQGVRLRVSVQLPVRTS
jgi:PAS domain S-box-containing protein